MLPIYASNCTKIGKVMATPLLVRCFRKCYPKHRLLLYASPFQDVGDDDSPQLPIICCFKQYLWIYYTPDINLQKLVRYLSSWFSLQLFHLVYSLSSLPIHKFSTNSLVVLLLIETSSLITCTAYSLLHILCCLTYICEHCLPYRRMPIK